LSFMSAEQLKLLILLVGITLVSGIADAQGFIHAAKIWQTGRLAWDELGKSAAGFSVGILLYWFALKYMNMFGIVTPEIQTVSWFTVTLVGVARITGTFFR